MGWLMFSDEREGTRPNLPIFIVDDDPVLVRQLSWLFEDEYKVLSALTFSDAVDKFLKHRPPLAILDLTLGEGNIGQDGIGLLRFFSESDSTFHGIILSGSIDHPRSLEAVRLGAYDLLDKTIEPEELKRIVKRAYNRALLGRSTPNSPPESCDEISSVFPYIVTKSTKIQDLLRLLVKISPTEISVLITGESGTGKELFARACHEKSKRKDGPFIPINCGAIPENLIESELFGHEKGAFTGAMESRPGKFEMAHQGTLFLDEVAELPVELQVKLLRVLQDKVVERVGGRGGKKLDVRIIAATNQPIEEMIGLGRFREDLFYRLSVMSFHLPPLRERSDDIFFLSQHFLQKFREEYQKNQLIDFNSECLELIRNYSWPGNIRELENKVQRAVIISTGKWILPEDLDISIKSIQGKELDVNLDFNMNLQETREEAEKRMLLEAFERTNGNISKVARLIGTSRPTVHAMIKKYGITPRKFKD